MACWLLWATATAILYLCNVLRQWRANWTKAKGTGLPCIVIPVIPFSLKLRILGPVLFPVLKMLPLSWKEPWLDHLDVMAQWNNGFNAYQRAGANSFVLVAPGGLVIITSSCNAIDDISHRRDHFQRPVELFKAIGRYGNNLACSEGLEWRRMRKLVARAFSEDNNREVWSETLYQVSKMLRRWKAGERINLNADTMQMSQNVISKAGFGYRMPWGDEDEAAAGVVAAKHGGLSYIQASRGLVQNILYVIGFPQCILKWSPFGRLRRVHKFDSSFRAHLRDTIRRGRLEQGGNDILHSLVREPEVDGDTLSDKEVLGNSFLFMVGGHETTATSMQMAIIFLALNVRAQRQMQLDIDRIVGDRNPDEWSYEHDLKELAEGWVGAVVQEELRLVPPVPAVLKRAVGDQVVLFDSIQSIVPTGTYLALSQIGAHRNPCYWPHGPPTDPTDPWHPKSNLDNDLEEFKPERWFARSECDRSESTSGDQQKQFFRPTRGAYFPFSEGARACVGRKFAEIEYIAVLAVIFRHYSVELDLREWVADNEIEAMNSDQKHTIWRNAAKRIRDTIFKDMSLLITMHLQSDTEFPLRLVKRGEEQFLY